MLNPASEVARSVTALWWSMAAGTGIILVLMVVLGVVAVRWNPPRSPGWRGVRVLLIAGGLLLPGGVIAALLVFGLRLDEAQWPPGARTEAPQAFHVDVTARQWQWDVQYPGLEGMPHTLNVVHVPAGAPVHLRIMSSDVIHGFWVPSVSGKLDAVPGRVNRLRLLIDTPGEYLGRCAEYCGTGHAHMPFKLVVHQPDDEAGLLAAIREDAP